MFKLCDYRNVTTSDVICVLQRLWVSQVIKKVVQLFGCAPKLREGLCFNLNKTVAKIKGYGLSKQTLLYTDIGKKLKNVFLKDFKLWV